MYVQISIRFARCIFVHFLRCFSARYVYLFIFIFSNIHLSIRISSAREIHILHTIDPTNKRYKRRYTTFWTVCTKSVPNNFSSSAPHEIAIDLPIFRPLVHRITKTSTNCHLKKKKGYKIIISRFCKRILLLLCQDVQLLQ